MSHTPNGYGQIRTNETLNTNQNGTEYYDEISGVDATTRPAQGDSTERTGTETAAMYNDCAPPMSSATSKNGETANNPQTECDTDKQLYRDVETYISKIDSRSLPD